MSPDYARRPLGLPPANPAYEVEELPPELEEVERYTTRFHLRTTPEQKEAWAVAARRSKLPLSTWVRDQLDEASEATGAGGDGFAERRLRMVRGIAVDLLDLRETYARQNSQLAAAIKRIEDRIDTLEGLVR